MKQIDRSALKRIALIYGVSRIYMGLLMAFYARYFTEDFTQRKLSGFDYFTVALTGDSLWYRMIADDGYPQNLLVYDDGTTGKTTWAFYPLWPILCRTIQSVTHLPFYIVASALVLCLGLAAAILFYKLLTFFEVNNSKKTIALVFMFFSPTGILFSLAYTEALAIVLLLLTLLWVAKEKYLLALIPIFLLGITRPITLALAIAFTFYVIALALKAKKAQASFPKRELLVFGSLSFYSGIVFLLWPVLVAVKFHRWDAYFYVQEAWRKFYTDPIIVWLVKDAHESWPLALLLAVSIFAICFIFAKTSWPLMMKAWAFGYLFFVLCTIPAGTGYNSDFANGTIFYPSTIRYLSLLLLPPLFFPPAGWPSWKKKVYWPTVAIITVAATLAYFRYFVITFPTTGPFYWL